MSNLDTKIKIKILDDPSNKIQHIDFNLDDLLKSENMKKTLINRINDDKKILDDKFFVVSAEYDRVFKKYNLISLTVMIMATLSTFIEAFRLLFIDYLKNININTVFITFFINALILFMGTIITILTSVVRFRNYRENLEKLKNLQNNLLKYKLTYDKCKISIENFYTTNNLNKITYDDFKEKLQEYNKEIKDINIQEDIRNSEYIKINKYKANFYYQLDKIKLDLEYKKDKLKNKYDILKKKNTVKHLKELKETNYDEYINQSSNVVFAI